MPRIFLIVAAVAAFSAPAFAAAPPRPAEPAPPSDPCWYAPRLIQCSPWFLGHMPVAPNPGGGPAPVDAFAPGFDRAAPRLLNPQPIPPRSR